MLGCAGYVAPRHMKAIQATGGELIAAMDPSDSVGILDSYSHTCQFFTNFERFDRHIDRLRRRGEGPDWLAVCTPNWLHEAHVRWGLKNGMNVLCEKPLCVNPENIDGMVVTEKESGKRVVPVLQLRNVPALVHLAKTVNLERTYDVELTYVTGRGPWFGYSWKMDPGKSGGVALNIGVHFLDALVWLFGAAQEVKISDRQANRIVGNLLLDRARVNFLLSTRFSDLPADSDERSYRAMRIDGDVVNLSPGFTDLHTLCYEYALDGMGPGIQDARGGVELAWELMHREVEPQAAAK